MYMDYCDRCEKKLECVERCKHGTLGAVRVAAAAQLPDAGLTRLWQTVAGEEAGGQLQVCSRTPRLPQLPKSPCPHLLFPVSALSAKVKTFHKLVRQQITACLDSNMKQCGGGRRNAIVLEGRKDWQQLVQEKERCMQCCGGEAAATSSKVVTTDSLRRAVGAHQCLK